MSTYWAPVRRTAPPPPNRPALLQPRKEPHGSFVNRCRPAFPGSGPWVARGQAAGLCCLPHAVPAETRPRSDLPPPAQSRPSPSPPRPLPLGRDPSPGTCCVGGALAPAPRADLLQALPCCAPLHQDSRSGCPRRPPGKSRGPWGAPWGLGARAPAPGSPARQPHHAVTPPPQSRNLHHQRLGPPGAVVMPAVTRAAGQEIPGVVGFRGGSRGMYQLLSAADAGPPRATPDLQHACPPLPAGMLLAQPCPHPTRPSSRPPAAPVSPSLGSWEPATRRLLGLSPSTFKRPAPRRQGWFLLRVQCTQCGGDRGAEHILPAAGGDRAGVPGPPWLQEGRGGPPGPLPRAVGSSVPALPLWPWSPDRPSSPFPKAEQGC